MIKNKIAVSISLHSKYGASARLLPSLQYLWCNYKIDNKAEAVMVGQKWVRRNELLNDVEPNNNLRL